MNYLIFVFYNGLFYRGSQSQLNFNTISDKIFFYLFKLNKKIYKTIFSGRTDSGVNSLYQIIHIFRKKVFLKKKIFLINNFLKNIFFFSIIQVSKKFHSIYSVISRIYCYIFSFFKNIYSYFFFLKFNINFYFLIYYIKYLIGLKNFFIFNSLPYLFNNIKLIYEINFFKKNLFFYFIIKSNSFLYNMIRNIISFLLYIIYNVYNISVFLYFFYLKYIFFLFPISPYSLFLIYINYPLKKNIIFIK